MIPKITAVKSDKLRKSAKGRNCTFNIQGVCNYTPETTVLCHIDSEFKGAALKSDDFFAAFGCSDCHSWLDQHKGSPEDRLFYSMRALCRTLRIWIHEGLIVVK